MFIVPEDRVPSIWVELKRRCTEAELCTSEEENDSAMPSARLSGNRVIAVTHWRRVLDRLAEIDSVRPDVRQLRALSDRMDVDAFLPVRADELTDVEVPRRLINYADLVEPIVEELKARGVGRYARTESDSRIPHRCPLPDDARSAGGYGWAWILTLGATAGRRRCGW